MPFGFLRRNQPLADPTAAVAAADSRPARAIEFEGLTDEWRLRGSMTLEGRLIDALNRRESIPVAGCEWAPIDGSEDYEGAPGIKALDPYDLIVVIATPETLGPMSDEERQAHHVHKVPFDVAVVAPPYRIVGTIRLQPGNEPDGLLDRGTQMFLALTEPIVTIGDKTVDLGPTADAIFLNRSYMREIEQIDRGTGLPLPRLSELGRGPGETG